MKILLACAAASLLLTIGYFFIFNPLAQEKTPATRQTEELASNDLQSQERSHKEHETNQDELDDHYHAISLEELNLDYMLDQFMDKIKNDPVVALDYFIVDSYINYVYYNDVSSDEAITAFERSIEPLQTIDKVSYDSTLTGWNQHRVVIKYTNDGATQELTLDVIKQQDAHTGQGYWSIATEVQIFLDQISPKH